jgi:hypothetical protein
MWDMRANHTHPGTLMGDHDVVMGDKTGQLRYFANYGAESFCSWQAGPSPSPSAAPSSDPRGPGRVLSR